MKYKLSQKSISAILALFFLIVGGFLVRPSLAEYALNKAGYYFNGGAYDLTVAVKWYKTADFLGSESSFIHYQLARIYFVENKLDEAKGEIDIALAQNPNNQRAFYIRGLIDGFAKNYEEAIGDFEKFTAWSPKEWAGWNDLAWASYEASDYVKAKNSALEGLKIDENNPWLLNNLGLAYLGLKEKDQAQEVFAKAKEKTDLLTLEDWQKAYPGNNPNTAKKELAKFKNNLRYNANLAFKSAPSEIALTRGISVSACAASSYGTCSGGTCQANSCTACDSFWDIIWGKCCSSYTSQCTTDAECSDAPINGACRAMGGYYAPTEAFLEWFKNTYGSYPSFSFCQRGSFSGLSGSGPWSWSCNGSGGGTSASCSAEKSISGVCGLANGQTYDNAPTSGFCDAGTFSGLFGSGPWSWNCYGIGGGSSLSSCSASKRNACTAQCVIINNNCSKSCGGGTKVVETCLCPAYDVTEACNTQPCPPGYREVTPW